MVIRSPGQVVSSGHQEYGERSGGKECDGWDPVLMCMMLMVTLHNCLEEEGPGRKAAAATAPHRSPKQRRVTMTTPGGGMVSLGRALDV